jgi:hypothetical protein
VIANDEGVLQWRGMMLHQLPVSPRATATS